jgi:ABC-2 type transport system permease protein
MSAEAVRVAIRRPTRTLFLHQLRSEQLVFWRSREAAFFIFLFPLLLYLLLGSVYSGKIYGVPAAQGLLAGLVGYGCANTAFAGLAIQLVIRREGGILKRLRSTPLPPVTYVAALLVSTLVVFVLQTVALFLLGKVLHGTPFPSDVGSLFVAIVIGSAAFAALGTATASLIRSAEGSSAVVNFILLPMAFLSGSFGPTHKLGTFLHAVAAVLPLKYFIDLVNAVYLHGQAVWSQPEALAVLAAWGVGGLVVTIFKFRWEPRER